MPLKQFLKNHPSLYTSILKVLQRFDYFNIRFRKHYPNYVLDKTWKQRIDLVKESSDNNKIKIVENAGKVFHDHQLMHNGLKISLGSYYNYGNTRLLEENKGIHEPQEEYVFQEVLKDMRQGATMLELGSYWAFYSMWFYSQVKDASCYMVEPDPHKMNFGKLNFRINNFEGNFDYGFISDIPKLNKSIPTLSVDYLMEKHQLTFLDVLHSDIQGYELKMLKGASNTLSKDKVGYIFISTHSQALHKSCMEEIEKFNFDILCDADLNETYSWDGLIVAKNKSYRGLTKIDISKKMSVTR